jgi:DNA polymerase-1
MARAQQHEAELNALIADILEEGETVNWNSVPQVKKVFESIGFLIGSTAFEVLSFIDDPVAKKLVQYREAKKRVGTYGPNWHAFLHDGRVYPDWRQIGAVSGRMSSSNPGMQTIPHLEGEPYRSCISVPEPGRLVIADYSQIELRIGAKIAGEQAMMAAYDRGADLHTLTAQQVLGVPTVTKQHRQLAKAINFGLLYGMGAERFQRYARLQYGVEMSLDQAKAYRESFFRAYPAIRKWHRSKLDEPETVRTLAGRWRIGIEAYSEKLNHPVQGTGADGLKLALALLWERRHDCPGGYPIIACHDEIVVETTADWAPAAEQWVKQAMLDGMQWLLDPIPTEVETKIATHWGAK